MGTLMWVKRGNTLKKLMEALGKCRFFVFGGYFEGGIIHRIMNRYFIYISWFRWRKISWFLFFTSFPIKWLVADSSIKVCCTSRYTVGDSLIGTTDMPLLPPWRWFNQSIRRLTLCHQVWFTSISIKSSFVDLVLWRRSLLTRIQRPSRNHTISKKTTWANTKEGDDY